MSETGHGAVLRHKYDAVCYSHHHADGSKCPSPWECPLGVSFEAHEKREKWVDWFFNTNPQVGLQKYLDATLKTGLASPVWYVGLVGTNHTYATTDSMGAHAGWNESTLYTAAPRPTWTPGAISGLTISNAVTLATFAINGNDTINGCFMVDVTTKGGATGTLLGEGDFTGGVKTVASGDTLNVQVTSSLA